MCREEFDEKSNVIVRVCKGGRAVDVAVGLKQQCVMSPWRFNLFMDGQIYRVESKNYECNCLLE